jgi:ATP-dependent helicase HrpB
VWVLEPRRLAARMAAARVADERGEPLGESVGVQVRFETLAGPRTRLRFVTEGVLLRRLADDPTLRGLARWSSTSSTSAAWRPTSGLALCRHARASARPDLRLVVMSATLDPAPVAAFLDAPVVSVPGREFPVDVRFAEREDTRHLEERVAGGVRRALAQTSGDVLGVLAGRGRDPPRRRRLPRAGPARGRRAGAAARGPAGTRAGPGRGAGGRAAR